MITKKSSFSADDIISQLAAIARADIADYIDVVDGNAVVKPLSLIPPRKRAAVALIKNGTGSKGAEIKLYDKMHALELLGKYFGIFDGSVSSDEETLKKLDEILENICA